MTEDQFLEQLIRMLQSLPSFKFTKNQVNLLVKASEIFKAATDKLKTKADL